MSAIIYKGIWLHIPDDKCPCNATLELKRHGSTWVPIFAGMTLQRGQDLIAHENGSLVLNSGDSIRFRRRPFQRKRKPLLSGKALGWGTGS